MTPQTEIEATISSVYGAARKALPAPNSIVVIAFADNNSLIATGETSHPDQISPFPLGLATLSAHCFPNGRVTELTVEQAIAEIEDIVMPWQRRLPHPATLFVAGDAIIETAEAAGMPKGLDPWTLSIDTLEQLFNRWVARLQGRPAGHDDLPLTARFSTALLVLRECLHHLKFNAVTVVKSAPQAVAPQD